METKTKYNKNTFSHLNDAPKNWDSGFKIGRYRVACNGLEIPCYHNCLGWNLMVWDTKNKKHLYYIYKSDTFIDVLN